jgi:hypothetical protein
VAAAETPSTVSSALLRECMYGCSAALRRSMSTGGSCVNSSSMNTISNPINPGSRTAAESPKTDKNDSAVSTPLHCSTVTYEDAASARATRRACSRASALLTTTVTCSLGPASKRLQQPQPQPRSRTWRMDAIVACWRAAAKECANTLWVEARAMW